MLQLVWQCCCKRDKCKLYNLRKQDVKHTQFSSNRKQGQSLLQQSQMLSKAQL